MIATEKLHSTNVAKATASGLVIFSTLLSFFYFLWLAEFYTLGDVATYKAFYQTARLESSIVDLYLSQVGLIGGAEPGYTGIVFIAAKFLSHEQFTMLSAIFYYSVLLKILHSNGLHPLKIIFFVTSYYFFITLLPAERLKLGIIVGLIGFLSKNSNLRYLFLGLSTLFHFQMAFALAAFYIHRNGLAFNRYPFIVLAGLAAIIFYLFSETLLNKISYYSDDISLIDSLKVMVLIVPLFIKRVDVKVALTLFFISGSVMLIGSERLLGLLIIYAIVVARVNEVGVLYIVVLFGYFVFKLIDLTYRVSVCGDGYTCAGIF